MLPRDNDGAQLGRLSAVVEFGKAFKTRLLFKAAFRGVWTVGQPPMLDVND